MRKLLGVGLVLVAISACNYPKPAEDASNEASEESESKPSDDSGEPAECRPNAGKALAAALGGFAQGMNGGPNTALEIEQERCQEAREAQRFNAEQRARMAQLQLERQRLELERQRLELERQRALAEEQERVRAASAEPQEPAPEAAPLLVFGGPSHKTFLGCLCSEFEENSVFNEHGKYGRFGFNVDNASLWAMFGMYRDRFSDYSACGSFTKDPPIVVTPQGQAVCRLTTDQTNQYQCKSAKLIDWLTHGPCGQ